MDRRRIYAESVRVLLAGFAGWFALMPFVRPGVMGGADSVWYAAMTRDYLLQSRAGEMPVFVGQTYLAPMGNVLPLRVAPLLQHLAGILDLATFRQFSPELVQNLVLVGLSIASALSAYLCVGSILPKRRNAALLLAVLYVFCPAAMGMVYSSDLFMSFTTLPFLPVVFAGIVHVFRSERFRGYAAIAAGCAGCWIGHSPIGLWTTAAATLALCCHLATGGWRREHWIRNFVGAGGIFAASCGYVFVSMSYLKSGTVAAPRVSDLLSNVQAVVPGVFLPVSPGADRVTDLQLGYGLWFVAVIGLIYAMRYRRAELAALTITIAALLCFVVPVPIVTDAGWRMLPQFVVDVTNVIPNQRLFAVLAAAVIVFFAAGLSLVSDRRWSATAQVCLVLAVVWSTSELRPFFYRAQSLPTSRQESRRLLRPENFAPTRFALSLLSAGPRNFSHGVMNWELEHRLLSQDLKGYLATNVGAVAPAFDHAPRQAAASQLQEDLIGLMFPNEKRGVPLRPLLRLEPGKRYLLLFEFDPKPYEGILQLFAGDVYREYILPSSGLAHSFGSGPENSRVIPLEPAGNQPVELRLEFLNLDPKIDIAIYEHFARFQLLEYDRGSLPVKLESLFPYVLTVRSPSAGWIETVRLYTPGWRATVDGKPVEVRASPDDLVAVPIDAGESTVRVFYRPPLALAVAYWVMVASWLSLVVGGCYWLVRMLKPLPDPIPLKIQFSIS